MRNLPFLLAILWSGVALCAVINVPIGGSIQKAIDQATPGTTIVIEAGTYKESLTISSSQITFTSASSDTVVIQAPTPNVVLINPSASQIAFYNIEIQEVAGEIAGNTAHAVKSFGSKIAFYFCKLVGFQDTVWWDAGSVYFYSSIVEGTVDFNYGAADVYFLKSNINSSGKGFVTAASTDQADPNGGFVFQACQFNPVISSIYAYRQPNNHSYAAPLSAAEYTSSVGLGRPWHNYPKVVIMNSYLNSHITKAGWQEWNVPTSDVFYAEYKNEGPGANTSGRVAWSKQLNATEAANYATPQVFFTRTGLGYSWIDPKYLS